MKLTPENIQSRGKLFNQHDIVLAQLEIPMNTVVKAAQLTKENGNVFILNPAPAHELPDELLPLIDYLTPNEVELEIISGLPVSDDDNLEKAAVNLIK
jgi:ribokinase